MTTADLIALYHTCDRCKFEDYPKNMYPCSRCKHGTDLRVDLWKSKEDIGDEDDE